LVREQANGICGAGGGNGVLGLGVPNERVIPEFDRCFYCWFGWSPRAVVGRRRAFVMHRLLYNDRSQPFIPVPCIVSVETFGVFFPVIRVRVVGGLMPAGVCATGSGVVGKLKAEEKNNLAIVRKKSENCTDLIQISLKTSAIFSNFSCLHEDRPRL